MGTKLRAYGLGTYYTNRSASDGSAAPDFRQLRNLVYAIKAKHPPAPFTVTHAWCSGPPAVIGSQADAVRFAAKAFAHQYKKEAYTLVPLPSSEVTRATMSTARWGANQLANALAALGFGTVVPAIVNKVAVESGQTRPFEEILANLDVVWSLPPTGTVVLVDDTVTRGSTLGAARTALGKRGSFAFVVGVTSNKKRDSALLPICRTFDVLDDGSLDEPDDELIVGR